VWVSLQLKSFPFSGAEKAKSLTLKVKKCWFIAAKLSSAYSLPADINISFQNI
jgi:hypothetical protein